MSKKALFYSFINCFFIFFSDKFLNLNTNNTAEIVNPIPKAIHIPKAPIFKTKQR